MLRRLGFGLTSPPPCCDSVPNLDDFKLIFVVNIKNMAQNRNRNRDQRTWNRGTAHSSLDIKLGLWQKNNWETMW